MFGFASLCSKSEVMLIKVESLWKQHRIYLLFQRFQIGGNVLLNVLIELAAITGSTTKRSTIVIYLRTLSLLLILLMITWLVQKIVLAMKKCLSLLMENVSATSNQGAKYLVFVSSCSVKTRELSFAQFLYFLRKVGQFLKDKIYNYVLFDIFVNVIIQKLTIMFCLA